MSSESPCNIESSCNVECGSCHFECHIAETIYRRKINSTLDDTKEKKEKTIKINGFEYSSLEVYNDNLATIGFIFDNKRYRVNFNYSLSSNYTFGISGNNNEERKSYFINNIQVQSKVKVGYSEYRNLNNSKYRNMKKITKFIQQVLIRCQ